VKNKQLIASPSYVLVGDQKWANNHCCSLIVHTEDWVTDRDHQ